MSAAKRRLKRRRDARACRLGRSPASTISLRSYSIRPGSNRLRKFPKASWKIFSTLKESAKKKLNRYINRQRNTSLKSAVKKRKRRPKPLSRRSQPCHRKTRPSRNRWKESPEIDGRALTV